MPKIGIDVVANVSKAKKDLAGLEKDIKKVQNTASKGASVKSYGKGSMSAAGGKSFSSGSDAFTKGFGGGLKTEFGELNKNLTSHFGKLGGALAGLGKFAANPYTAAAAAGVSVLKLQYDHFKQKATEQAAQIKEERSYANIFRGIRGDTIDKSGESSGAVEKLIKNLRLLSTISGKPFDQIAQSAGRLMIAFNGSTSETLKYTRAITAWSIATGRSTDELADLIVKIESMDRVEGSVIKQMSEMGIPIYEELSKILGVSVDKAKELANNGAIYADAMLQAFENTSKAHQAQVDLGKAVKGNIDSLSGTDLDTRVAYLERRLYGKSGEAAIALEEREKRDRANDMQDILDSPSAKLLAEAGGSADLVDNIWYTVKRAGYKGVEGLSKLGAWGGYHLRGFTSSRGGLTDSDYEKYAKDILRHAKGENDKYRGHTGSWSRRGLSMAQGIAQEGAWQDKKTGAIIGVQSAEEAAKALMEGGSDTKLKAIEDAFSQYETLMYSIEDALKLDWVSDETKAALQKELDYINGMFQHLKDAIVIRNAEVKKEVEILKKKKTADKLQTAQWEKDGEFLKIWNKSHTKDDNKFLSNITSEEEALKLYEEGIKEIREGRGDEVIQNYVKFWEAFWKKAQEDKKKAEEEAEKKAKEEAEKAEKEKKKAKDRKKFFLEHHAKNDEINAGAEFKSDLVSAQDRMRELGIHESTMKLIGDDMKKTAKKPFEKEIKDRTKEIDDVAWKLRGLGVTPTAGNQQRHQQWVWDEMEKVPRDKDGKVIDKLVSYERGAWGQGLRIEQYDETALQIQEQRKDLLEQLKVLNEQKSIAEKQLKAIEAINTTPRAQ